MRIATIIARRELARARVLAESVARHDPRDECVVLVLDAAPEDSARVERFEQVRVEDIGIENFGQLAARLELGELREAVKPLLLRQLLGRSAPESVLYLDADSWVCGPLDDLERLAQDHGVIVSARTRAPLPPDGRRPNEADLRGWGLYDPGLIVLGAGHDHEELLDWWAARAVEGAAPDTGAQPIERLATIMPSHREVDDPGLGASFWNLHGRSIERRGDGVTVDGVPLRLLRLSGFNYEQPTQLSDAQDRIHVADHPSLEALLRAYAERLIECGEPLERKLPYAWERLPDGTRLDRRLRDIYARALQQAKLRRSPFEPWGMEEFYAWLAEPAPAGRAFGINRLCWMVREAQPQLREAYPDLDRAEDASGLIGWLNAYGTQPGTLPTSLVAPLSAVQELEERRHTPVALPWGVNVAGYFESELGVGEAARLVVAALDSADVALSPVHGRSVPASRQGHAFTSLDAEHARFPVNLVCVNADGLPGFREEVGEGFFAGRHTIGMWWWEVSRTPVEWRSTFGLVDEIWVGSEHVAKALSVDSPVPVYTVTLPVRRPRVEPLAREALGVPEGFVFLFMFDYHSVFERKNPLATVEAFKRAFAPGAGASLVLKCINGADDLRNRARLLAAVGDHEDIHVLDGYLSPAENDALIAACDCYVSLHRSEGFGLTPAEAMALGKPVIATGYSGNLDYMTAGNAHLVDYTLRDIGPGNAPYPPEGQWAEPDVEHAARLMREVFDDQPAAHAMGERAAADIARTHSLEASGRSMKARLESLRARLPSTSPASAAHAEVKQPALDTSRTLRSRLARYVAREQLRVVHERIAEQRQSIADSDREIERVRGEMALLQAEVLAALRRKL
ncbi:MAG TPA: glycosyltransferase family 4 protein [Solirubrobacteraceae bacterium]